MSTIRVIAKKVLPSRLQLQFKRSKGLIHRKSRRVRWGNLRRMDPFSSNYGLDRGESIDRPYVDSFIERHSADIRGAVLEVMDARYTSRFGGEAVTTSDILDIDRGNRNATIIADLAAEGSLPSDRFDCVLVTQTLQLVKDLPVALRNLWQCLRPGGTALITMPVLCRLDLTWGPDNDYWRLSPAGLQHLIVHTLEAQDVQVEGHGNLTAAVAFLLGLSAEELRPSEYAVNDPHYPVVACARVLKIAHPR